MSFLVLDSSQFNFDASGVIFPFLLDLGIFKSKSLYPSFVWNILHQHASRLVFPFPGWYIGDGSKEMNDARS